MPKKTQEPVEKTEKFYNNVFICKKNLIKIYV